MTKNTTKILYVKTISFMTKYTTKRPKFFEKACDFNDDKVTTRTVKVTINKALLFLNLV